MNFKEIVVLSLESIWDRKVKSILTIMMVVVGSALLVAVSGIGAGFTVTFSKQFSSLAPNVIFVLNSNLSPGAKSVALNPPKLVIDSGVVSRIHQLPNIADIVPSFRGSVVVTTPSETRTETLIAMDPDKIKVITPTVSYAPGSEITKNPNSLIVATDVAHPSGDPLPFINLGQTVSVKYTYTDPVSLKATTQTKNFKVTAIMEETGNTYVDNSMFISLDAGNLLFQKGGKYDSISVLASSTDLVDSVENNIFQLYGNNVAYTSVKAIMETIQAFTRGFNSFLTSIGIVALIVGSVGVITTLYTSVIDRTKEIGTLKAIGAQNRHVLSLFLVEALLIGVIGASIGLGTGFGFGAVLSNFMSASPPSAQHGGGGGGGHSHGPPSSSSSHGSKASHTIPIYDVKDLIRVWFISVGLSTLAGVMPAIKASRLLPIKALRTQ